MIDSSNNNRSQTRLTLLGPPGSGKGTQAATLAETLEVPHIASGDLFRYHQLEGTQLGIKASEYMKQGLLVPDEITIQMTLDKIASPESNGGFVLDGFPRNLTQARALSDNLYERQEHLDAAILIDVPEQELVQRLSGRSVCSNCQIPYHSENAPPRKSGVCDHCGGSLYQRQDDTIEAIQVRIKVYREATQPLIDYYKDLGILSSIYGTGAVDEVGLRLLQAIKD